MTSVNTTIPPAPFSSPVTNQNGIMTQAWAKWFTQVFLSLGGSSGTSIAGVQSAITTLQTDVAANTANITTLQTDFSNLSVGHHL